MSMIYLVVAEMDYDWKMGVEFKNYEEGDKKRQEQDESGDEDSNN